VLVKLCLLRMVLLIRQHASEFEVLCLACLLVFYFFQRLLISHFPFSLFSSYSLLPSFCVRLKILHDDGRCFRFAVSVVAAVFVGHIQYMTPAARRYFVRAIAGVRMTAPL